MALVNRLRPFSSDHSSASPSSSTASSSNNSSSYKLVADNQKSKNAFSFDKALKFTQYPANGDSMPHFGKSFAEKSMNSTRTNSQSEKLINGLLHSNFKSGKIAKSKRKNERKDGKISMNQNIVQVGHFFDVLLALRITLL